MRQSNFGMFALYKIIIFATMAQEVEHFLGKEEVTGSNPVSSSI